MMGNTSAIYETLEKCDPYTKQGESYEDNAPTITDDFEFHTGYYYEYFWNGETWMWSENKSPMRPISEFEGKNADW
jgi:hypothetical protein